RRPRNPALSTARFWRGRSSRRRTAVVNIILQAPAAQQPGTGHNALTKRRQREGRPEKGPTENAPPKRRRPQTTASESRGRARERPAPADHRRGPTGTGHGVNRAGIARSTAYRRVGGSCRGPGREG